MDNETCSRIAVLHLQNDIIGDDLFAPEIANTLREYADMIDRNEAGHTSCERYEGPRGTKLMIIASTWFGTQIPQSEQLWPHLPPYDLLWQDG